MTSENRKKPASFYLGIVFLLAGAIIAGYLVWAYVGTNIVANHRQENLKHELKDKWQENKKEQKVTKPAKEGLKKDEPFALIRIPRFGKGYEMPVVKGLSDEALGKGVGWDDNSALPGQVGNMVVAAHRITNGEPFRNFPSLEAGDMAYVETQDFIYSYKLRQGGEDWVVEIQDDWVTDPIPEENVKQEATESLITLITCTDLFHSDRRSIVVGELVETQEK